MSSDSNPVSTQMMIPVEEIPAADLDHVGEVVDLAEEASAYLASMPWCQEIIGGWLAYSSGYIIGVFYFRIVPTKPDAPSFVWVIVGDMPPAYFDGETHLSAYVALDAYVREMQAWVDRVQDGLPLDDDVITVNVPPEKRWAKELQSRLDSIREMFLGADGELL